MGCCLSNEYHEDEKGCDDKKFKFVIYTDQPEIEYRQLETENDQRGDTAVEHIFRKTKTVYGQPPKDLRHVVIDWAKDYGICLTRRPSPSNYPAFAGEKRSKSDDDNNEENQYDTDDPDRGRSGKGKKMVSPEAMTEKTLKTPEGNVEVLKSKIAEEGDNKEKKVQKTDEKKEKNKKDGEGKAKEEESKGKVSTPKSPTDRKYIADDQECSLEDSKAKSEPKPEKKSLKPSSPKKSPKPSSPKKSTKPSSPKKSAKASSPKKSAKASSPKKSAMALTPKKGSPAGRIYGGDDECSLE